jgi:DNA-directed RNA polymerase specialized sigma24 family protein
MPWPEERRALYARLLDEGLDAEALHQLLVEKGPTLLDAAVPYLVVAARNRALSSARRDHRRSQLEEREALSRPSAPTLDPAELVVARSALTSTIVALGNLKPTYSWPLWWHAAGFDDDEIVSLWDAAGFRPPSPSLATVRKRRERARAQLRKLLEGEDE